MHWKMNGHHSGPTGGPEISDDEFTRRILCGLRDARRSLADVKFKLRRFDPVGTNAPMMTKDAGLNRVTALAEELLAFVAEVQANGGQRP